MKESQALRGKYKAKEWIKLKEISGDEAKILNSVYNVPFGAYGISHSYSRHKKYYLCECKNNLMALNEIRKAEKNIGKAVNSRWQRKRKKLEYLL